MTELFLVVLRAAVLTIVALPVVIVRHGLQNWEKSSMYLISPSNRPNKVATIKYQHFQSCS